jgi:hypothetical protein
MDELAANSRDRAANATISKGALALHEAGKHAPHGERMALDCDASFDRGSEPGDEPIGLVYENGARSRTRGTQRADLAGSLPASVGAVPRGERSLGENDRRAAGRDLT